MSVSSFPAKRFRQRICFYYYNLPSGFPQGDLQKVPEVFSAGPTGSFFQVVNFSLSSLLFLSKDVK